MLFRQAVGLALVASVVAGADAAATVMVPGAACATGACPALFRSDSGSNGSDAAAVVRVQPGATPAPARTVKPDGIALAAVLGLLALAFRFVPRRSALPEVAS